MVVKELSLTIEDKEFFTFVGPSGCGKSTVLGMIAGLEPATAGTISFDGRPVNDVSPGDRDVAMVFQSYALYPHMNVYEKIAFPLRVKKVSKEKIESGVSEVADILGLKHLLTRRPKELSGGQRQRVALGRAVIRRPKAFLMDEPLSNLDARLRIEMRAELKRIHNEFQITTVYVTHDQEEALVLSDRVAVLYQGELQQCGPSFEVYEKPANRFVAEFIGSPPMNIFEAELLADLPAFQSLWKRMQPKDAVLGIRPHRYHSNGSRRTAKPASQGSCSRTHRTRSMGHGSLERSKGERQGSSGRIDSRRIDGLFRDGSKKNSHVRKNQRKYAFPSRYDQSVNARKLTLYVDLRQMRWRQSGIAFNAGIS